jgi:hypothetical protein
MKMKQRGTWALTAIAAVLATALVAVPTAATADQPIKTITAGAGLTGGGTGPSVTLAVANGGITNAMLANPALSILAGTGLLGGGSVALGGSTTLGIANGGVDTTQLAAGAVTPGKLNATGSSDGQVLTSNGLNVSWQSLPPTNAWSLGGNAGTITGTNFLGTTDNVPLELKVNGSRAFRLEPDNNGPNVIGGFSGNSVSAGAFGATIGGGGSSSLGSNSVSASFGTVAGGIHNSASGILGTVGGGQENNASSSSATVAGGAINIASGSGATVAGGLVNTADGYSSFAAGNHAKAMHDGSFVWADDHLANFGSTASNEFSARATGGVRFVSGFDSSGNPTGVSLAAGSGSWSSLSDRALKRNFAAIDGSSILERIAGLPISTWSYKAQKPAIRHLGPTAQDFGRAFGLGEDKRHIDTIDSEGVSLAGIKALYKLAQTQQRRLDKQGREIRALQRQLRVLQAR